MELICKIRERRELEGVTQKDLAEAVGMSVSHMCMIEKGKRFPSVPVLFKISRRLQVSAGFLYEVETSGGSEK